MSDATHYPNIMSEDPHPSSNENQHDIPANISAKPSEYVSFGKIIFWTLAFQLAWNWNSLKNIFTQGTLQGPDDFMRLVQVRALLSGQPWYDLTAYRMFLPSGADIHWSRLIDAPLAGLIYTLSPPIWPTNSRAHDRNNMANIIACIDSVGHYKNMR